MISISLSSSISWYSVVVSYTLNSSALCLHKARLVSQMAFSFSFLLCNAAEIVLLPSPRPSIPIDNIYIILAPPPDGSLEQSLLFDWPNPSPDGEGLEEPNYLITSHCIELSKSFRIEDCSK